MVRKSKSNMSMMKCIKSKMLLAIFLVTAKTVFDKENIRLGAVALKVQSRLCDQQTGSGPDLGFQFIHLTENCSGEKPLQQKSVVFYFRLTAASLLSTLVQRCCFSRKRFFCHNFFN